MVKPTRAMRVESCMDTNQLYKEVEALRERLAQANREIEVAQQAVALERSKSEGYLQQVKALSATVEDHRKKM